MGPSRLLQPLAALLAASGAVTITLEATALAVGYWTPAPFPSWGHLLYYIVVNAQAILFSIGTGLAMIALGLLLYHWTGRHLARTKQQP